MTVRHAGGRYEVAATTLADALAALPEDAAVLTDANVAAFAPLPKGVPTLVLPPGEATKSLHWFGEALGWLARQGASRRTTVVALGGGVVGDLAGFVAAAYMRGRPPPPRFRPRSSRWSTPASAARWRSTCPRARTSPGRSGPLWRFASPSTPSTAFRLDRW